MIKLRKVQMDELKTKGIERFITCECDISYWQFPEADLKVLAHVKATTDSKNLELQQAQKKLDNLKEMRNRLEEDMKPIQDRLTKIFTIEREISELTAKKIEYETR